MIRATGEDTRDRPDYVFNQIYWVTSADVGERAARVARLMDSESRIWETAAQITTHDVAKITILTALQIADDLLTRKEMYEV